MIYRKPRIDEQSHYELFIDHPLQSYSWGSFRKETHVDVERLVGFDGSDMAAALQVTFHSLPYLPYTIGYYPKGRWPDEIQLQALRELGAQKQALFIKLEPNVSSPPYNQADIDGLSVFLEEHGCKKGRPMFTPYSFILDLTSDEDALLAGMKSKTRYNIRVAEKHGVEIVEDSTDAGFEDYLRLLGITTQRQGFYAHGKAYQRAMWRVLHEAGIARILKAVYQGEVISAWVLFHYKHTLYYPYGASSRNHRNVMASNLLMWEAIRLGKRSGCTTFDMWGALGPDANDRDPWYGFHKFKAGYGEL